MAAVSMSSALRIVGEGSGPVLSAAALGKASSIIQSPCLVTGLVNKHKDQRVYGE